jgi:hypothetical protein
MTLASSNMSRNSLRWPIVLTVVATLTSRASSQVQADPRTLTPSATLNAIAARVSGAQARNHVLEMCPFERNRPAGETPLEPANREECEGIRFSDVTSSDSHWQQTVGWRNGGAVGH